MYNYGVGIITCDRPNFLKLCIESLPKEIGKNIPLVIVNDGKTDIPKEFLKSKNNVHIIKHTTNKGVGVSKNDALKKLLELNVDHLFLVEDDIKFLDKTVFDKYIEAAIKTGILHFNYGPGSPFNRKQENLQMFDLHNRHLAKQDTPPDPRLIIDYGNNIKIALYLHTVAMFSYFHKKVIEDVGYIDEAFFNAWEHVDHTYRIIKAGYHPPFWYFADLVDSDKLLTEAPGAIDSSSIASKSDQWHKNVMSGREIYKQKHGHYPNMPPLISEQETLNILKQIFKKWTS